MAGREQPFALDYYYLEMTWDDPGYWWVYVLSEHGDRSMLTISCTYVGMARNVRRRLSEHARVWPSSSGHALLIAVRTEQQAQNLEAALIALFEPRGNVARPALSWIERKWFDQWGPLWDRGGLHVCGGCRTLCRDSSEGLEPIVEPDEECVHHNGWKRRVLGHGIEVALMSGRWGWLSPAELDELADMSIMIGD